MLALANKGKTNLRDLQRNLQSAKKTAQRIRGAITVRWLAVLYRYGLYSGNPVSSYAITIIEAVQPALTTFVPAPLDDHVKTASIDLSSIDGSPILPAKFDRPDKVDPSLNVYKISRGTCNSRGRIATFNGQLVNANLLRQRQFLKRIDDFGALPFNQPQAGSTLAATYAFQHGYYHWMLEVVPKMLLARDLQIPLDAVYVDQSHSFQVQCVAWLNKAGWKVVAADGSKLIVADDLYAIDSWDAFAGTPSWVCKRLRDEFLADSLTSPTGRLFISRQDSTTRLMSNEDELYGELARYGFRRVTLASLTVMEQVQLFAGASAVVSAHGAGMTNIVFCSPGTMIFEITPPRYVFGCFCDLARRCGLRYQLLTSIGVDFRNDHGWAYQFESFAVDTLSITRAIADKLRLNGL